MISLPKPKPKASGTAGCEKIVGMRVTQKDLAKAKSNDRDRNSALLTPSLDTDSHPIPPSIYQGRYCLVSSGVRSRV